MLKYCTDLTNRSWMKHTRPRYNALTGSAVRTHGGRDVTEWTMRKRIGQQAMNSTLSLSLSLCVFISFILFSLFSSLFLLPHPASLPLSLPPSHAPWSVCDGCCVTLLKKHHTSKQHQWGQGGWKGGELTQYLMKEKQNEEEGYYEGSRGGQRWSPGETREMRRAEAEERRSEGGEREGKDRERKRERGSRGRGGKRQRGADNEFRQKEPGHLNYK